MDLALNFDGVLLESNFSGLANRLRGIASVYALTDVCDAKMLLRWTPNWACDGQLEDLVRLPEWSGIRKLGHGEQTPERHWYVSGATWPKCGGTPTEFLSLLRNDPGETDEFDGAWRSFIRGILPSDEVARRLETLSESADLSSCLGIHLRGTDHVSWRRDRGIDEVTPEQLQDKVSAELERLGLSSIYLSTDDPALDASFRSIFADHIPFAPQRFSEAINSRSTSTLTASTDLFALASCSRILGTKGSSFGWLAGKIGGVAYAEAFA